MRAFSIAADFLVQHSLLAPLVIWQEVPKGNTGKSRPGHNCDPTWAAPNPSPSPCVWREAAKGRPGMSVGPFLGRSRLLGVGTPVGLTKWEGGCWVKNISPDVILCP